MASAVTQPLLDTIEADDPTPTNAPSRGVNNSNTNANGAKPREPVVLMPGNSATAMGSQDLESGISGIFRQSSHPVALFFLYAFRIAAIVVYILGGYLITDYVISTVVVVLLLSADFWNCRNVSGRTLVGLRFWNQVDEDGQSYWIFESRDPSRPANAIDSKMFWTALYVFPVLWVLLFILSILQLDLSFLPIVGLALVFNFTNVIGFTYADRDAKTKWANNIVSDNWSIGGFGGQIMGSVVKSSISRVLR